MLARYIDYLNYWSTPIKLYYFLMPALIFVLGIGNPANNMIWTSYILSAIAYRTLAFGIARRAFPTQ